jgi:hypothetical protein
VLPDDSFQGLATWLLRPAYLRLFYQPVLHILIGQGWGHAPPWDLTATRILTELHRPLYVTLTFVLSFQISSVHSAHRERIAPFLGLVKSRLFGNQPNLSSSAPGRSRASELQFYRLRHVPTS